MNSKDYWSLYWKEGHKTSFGSSLERNYEGELKNIWLNVFSNVDKGHKVLDLCTGNATLIRLAMDTTPLFPHINFTGVDYANICIDEEIKSYKNVEVLGDLNIEDLPFAPISFDLITSNFGIEYSHLKSSLMEVNRLLKVGGKLELICHHYDSCFIQDSLNCLKALRVIHSPSGPFMILKKLVELLSKENMTEADKVRTTLNSQLSNLVAENSSGLINTDFLSFLKHLMKNKNDDKFELLNIYSRESLAFKNRLTDMIDASLTTKKLEELKVLLGNLSFNSPSVEVVSEDKNVLAYYISSIKL